jgi:hypothetical protein
LSHPKSLVHALYQHWDTIENLVLLSREFPAFEPAQVLAVIARCLPAKSSDDREALLRQMVSADLLQVLPRGTAVQIHPLVLEFVRGLTREHELGLSAVLKARVDAIKQATGQLLEGLHAKDAELLRQAAIQLAELFRQISRQLDQDRHAILELAEKVKAQDANLPIARRYREVLAAYDGYVEPMAEMMDSGASGTFYRHLEAAEQALDHAVETLTIQGALYSQRLAMRQVAYQAKELRKLGREVLKQCSDTLLPLREEVRQHNALSASISHLLGRVRKRGLNATLKPGDLPLWRRDTPRRVQVGDEVLAIMAKARDYQPVSLLFPADSPDDTDHLRLDLVDESLLLQEVRKALPIANLLHWLHEHYPQLNDVTVLRLYHSLLEREDWRVTPAEVTQTQPLNHVRVIHYPHALAP